MGRSFMSENKRCPSRSYDEMRMDMRSVCFSPIMDKPLRESIVLMGRLMDDFRDYIEMDTPGEKHRKEIRTLFGMDDESGPGLTSSGEIHFMLRDVAYLSGEAFLSPDIKDSLTKGKHLLDEMIGYLERHEPDLDQRSRLRKDFSLDVKKTVQGKGSPLPSM